MNARLAAAALLLIGAGCAYEPDTRHFTFYAFGTLVELTVAGTDGATADRARALSARRLDEWHRQWHAWDQGPLKRMNDALAAGRRASTPESLSGLVPRAKTLSRASDGLFEPAIGRLVALWGFHADTAPAGPPPPDSEVRALAALRPSMDDLVILDDGAVRSANPALQLDFGAFAKGMALRRLSAELADLGIRNFLLNAGGDLVVAGRRGDRAWRVGVRQPHGTGVLASIEPRDGEAVFTSGDYERYFDWEDRRYHHIIDPRTGFPARGVRSVTVVHEDAALADAAATAVFVAGPDAAPGVARRMGVDRYMLVDAGGTVHLTPAMKERIELEPEPGPHVRIQKP